MGCRVKGLGFWVSVLGYRVEGSGGYEFEKFRGIIPAFPVRDPSLVEG